MNAGTSRKDYWLYVGVLVGSLVMCRVIKKCSYFA